jgi:hypothetical protein
MSCIEKKKMKKKKEETKKRMNGILHVKKTRTHSNKKICNIKRRDFFFTFSVGHTQQQQINHILHKRSKKKKKKKIDDKTHDVSKTHLMFLISRPCLSLVSHTLNSFLASLEGSCVEAPSPQVRTKCFGFSYSIISSVIRLGTTSTYLFIYIHRYTYKLHWLCNDRALKCLRQCEEIERNIYVCSCIH